MRVQFRFFILKKFSQNCKSLNVKDVSNFPQGLSPLFIQFRTCYASEKNTHARVLVHAAVQIKKNNDELVCSHPAFTMK